MKLERVMKWAPGIGVGIVICGIGVYTYFQKPESHSGPKTPFTEHEVARLDALEILVKSFQEGGQFPLVTPIERLDDIQNALTLPRGNAELERAIIEMNHRSLQGTQPVTTTFDEWMRERIKQNDEQQVHIYCGGGQYVLISGVHTKTLYRNILSRFGEQPLTDKEISLLKQGPLKELGNQRVIEYLEGVLHYPNQAPSSAPATTTEVEQLKKILSYGFRHEGEVIMPLTSINVRGTTMHLIGSFHPHIGTGPPSRADLEISKIIPQIVFSYNHNEGKDNNVTAEFLAKGYFVGDMKMTLPGSPEYAQAYTTSTGGNNNGLELSINRVGHEDRGTQISLSATDPAGMHSYTLIGTDPTSQKRVHKTYTLNNNPAATVYTNVPFVVTEVIAVGNSQGADLKQIEQ